MSEVQANLILRDPHWLLLRHQISSNKFITK